MVQSSAFQTAYKQPFKSDFFTVFSSINLINFFDLIHSSTSSQTPVSFYFEFSCVQIFLCGTCPPTFISRSSCLSITILWVWIFCWEKRKKVFLLNICLGKKKLCARTDYYSFEKSYSHTNTQNSTLYLWTSM